MLRKERIGYHKEMVLELEDVTLKNIKYDESSYLVDYLYGISDVYSFFSLHFSSVKIILIINLIEFKEFYISIS